MQTKIILIHGLNNTVESLYPLRDKLLTFGFEVQILCLPCHGDKRNEAKNLKEAFAVFDRSMKKMIQDPYVVIAFSQGALYLQLWLEKNVQPKPLAQILLAPALYIRQLDRLHALANFLPSFLMIWSQTPRAIRRYFYLSVREYRILFDGSKMFQSFKTIMRIPTLIMIDPKDEVVDGHLIEREVKKRASAETEFVFYERKHLKGWRPGKYHIIFHPSYFSSEDWESFVGKMVSFINEKGRPEGGQ